LKEKIKQENLNSFSTNIQSKGSNYSINLIQKEEDSEVPDEGK